MHKTHIQSGKTWRHVAWRRGVAAAVALAISGVVYAQSNAVGSIFGNAEASDKVVITNAETGAVRTATVDSNGRFQIPSLPVGAYKVELQKDGKTLKTKDKVLVGIGAGSEVDFGEEVLEEIVVSGTKSIIDTSSTDTRTVFTADELRNVTVKQSIEELAMIAPGVVRGDSRYNTNRGNSSASFGGSGANENAFYINGYAVTDPIKGLGSSSLPFDGIAQYQLLTGGYGAEFGRSTGGVVNIVTKSGSNTPVFGISVNYTPSDFTNDIPDSRIPFNNGTAQDGQLYLETHKRQIDSKQIGLYVGGPIIQDKLFFYVDGEFEKRTIVGPQAMNTQPYRRISDGLSGWHDRDITVPRWLAKVDWNIADGHSLELTAISDVRNEANRYFEYYNNSLPTAPRTPKLALRNPGTVNTGGFDYKDGGNLYIAKYTGAIMDNLIFTALYGRQKTDHLLDPYGYDSSIVTIRDTRSDVANPLQYNSYLSLGDPTAYDKTDGYRLDLNWIVGSHDLRAGYDVQNLEYKDGSVIAGPGYYWEYRNVPVSQANQPITGSGGAAGPGGNGDYVVKAISSSGGTFTTDQYAFFIEDRWKLTDTIMLSLGLRNESFKNYNSDKVVFLDQTNQWAPRIGLSWDIKGDSSLRAFANAGRYHLAIPLNLAFRQVGGSTNTTEFFKFTGIDPVTGVPQGVTALGSGPYSSNNEYGQARDPLSAAASGLKPYFQDEFALGFEAKVPGGMKTGARLIYRSLGSQIDDNCDFRPAYLWALANGRGNGLDVVNYLGEPSAADPAVPAAGDGLDDLAAKYGAQLQECRIINPGESNTLRLTDPVTGDPVYAKITKEQWGLPKLKRVYKGIDLFLEHPFRDKWYGKIDYTLSSSKGNAEGMLYSDSGQADVAVTANWDSPELMSGAYGYLPNDRRHQIKAFGYYQTTPELQFSATLSILSGRPLSFAGNYDGDALLHMPTVAGSPYALTDNQYHADYFAYNGPYYHWVNGVISPRGTGGRLPWTTTLDVGMRYMPKDSKLTFGLDIFNLMNTTKVQSEVEQIRTADNTIVATGYMPISYNAPRSVRFSFRYDVSGK